MPSDSLGRRVALPALCIVVAALASTPASSQAMQQRLRADRKAAAQPLAPLSQPAPPLRQLDLEVPVAAAPVMRGAQPEKDPPISTSSNYGAPRKAQRLPRLYPPRRVYPPPPFSPRNVLPKLEPYRTSAIARRASKLKLRATTLDPPPAPPPPATVAALPRPTLKPKPKVEEKPFDPIGVGIGSLRLYPYAEVSGGYDDNPNRLAPNVTGKRGSATIRAEGGFALRSEWARHSLNAEFRGGYSDYFDVPLANRPDGAGTITARLDAARDTSFDVLSRFSLDTIRPGAPAISSGIPSVTVVNRPIVVGAGVQAGPTQRFGPLEVALRGTYDRVFYENSRFSDGTILDLARTSYNQFGAVARASYELTPNLKPFVEGTFNWRIHDSPTDFNGFYRNSSGFTVRGGARVNFTELLKGEVSGGYGERHYQDVRLAPLRGPVVDAALIYTPSALTTVTLRGTTSLSETTLANASGVLTQNVSLQLSHDLLRNLNVSLQGSYYTNDYQGADVFERGYTAGVRLEYKVTRSITLRGSFMHERLDSSFPNADYTANVYLVGLRFQL